MDTANLLRELSETWGISGAETTVAQVVARHFRHYTEQVSLDRMGNIIALKEGASTRQPRPRIMLAAHMDEIGLMVTMLDQGFLRFTTVGGFDRRVLPGQQVIVHGRRNLPGVVGAPPPHLTTPEERRNVIDIHDLFIDVGMTQTELSETVQVGDFVSLERPFGQLAGDAVSGKAFDDRAGVASVVLAFDLIANQKHAWDILGVATVQEEVGLYGGQTAAFGLYPDVAIAIDVGFADSPGVDPADSATMGKGPAIAFGPNVNPVVFERLTATARQLELPIQVQAEPGRSGTDAWAMQVARGGVPTAIVSIPLRYMHTTVETVSKSDIERTARLLAAFATSLQDDFIEELTPSI